MSPKIQAIIDHIKAAAVPEEAVQEGDAVISVHRLTSTAGAQYEKLRYLLDYKDEHAIKRSAVARILKRKFLIEGTTDIGQALLQELIVGGYLPNKQIPEKRAVAVQSIANPYFFLLSKVREIPGADALIVGLAASEISRFLFPAIVEEAVLEAFYRDVRERIKINTTLTPEDLDTAVYVACRRGLLREENDLVGYALWLRFSKWTQTISGEDMEILAKHFAVVQARIKDSLAHPLGWELVPKLRNRSIYYAVLSEVLNRYGAESAALFSDPGRLEQVVREILHKHYKYEREKTARSAIRAIFYIFATKLILGLALELPYDYYIMGAIEYVPIISNIVFHPVLLFLMTRIPPLGDKNSMRIFSGIDKIVRGEEKSPIVVKRDGASALSTIFTLLYFGLFALCFGALVFALYKFGFNMVAILLFLFFLTLVSFFGLRIRHNARRWQVYSGEEGTLSLLWGTFTLPIVRMGRFLSRTFQSINIFVFILDFIIESPFKLLLNISDAFASFLREKREETF